MFTLQPNDPVISFDHVDSIGSRMLTIDAITENWTITLSLCLDQGSDYIITLQTKAVIQPDGQCVCVCVCMCVGLCVWVCVWVCVCITTGLVYSYSDERVCCQVVLHRLPEELIQVVIY